MFFLKKINLIQHLGFSFEMFFLEENNFKPIFGIKI